MDCIHLIRLKVRYMITMTYYVWIMMVMVIIIGALALNLILAQIVTMNQIVMIQTLPWDLMMNNLVVFHFVKVIIFILHYILMT